MDRSWMQLHNRRSPQYIDGNWYCYGKTVAEKVAWKVAKEKGVDLVVVIPVLVIGPLLQPILKASSIHILKYLNGFVKTYANAVQAYVHVKDTSLGYILIYETPSASGRYICAEGNRVIHRGEVLKFWPSSSLSILLLPSALKK